MSQPSEKHMEDAGEICSRISEFGEPAQDVIANALANAEREGMRRAADVVRAGREVSDPNDNYRSTIMVNWDDDDACADAILSEIGDKP